MIRTSTPLKKALKPKRCRHCGNSFQPISSLSKACSVPCAIALTDRDKAKKLAKAKAVERQSMKERAEKIKTRAEHMKELQIAFNAWVRQRDAGQPCITVLSGQVQAPASCQIIAGSNVGNAICTSMARQFHTGSISSKGLAWRRSRNWRKSIPR